ncbi:hypothetical protein [uncultured Bacteroides sp.]|uniref:hypothetical protein n=1 Tax=uncultured Bacteroides sp. TaxID=162156 RepID=UPI002AA68929|nr:hypothetical protein [uncultured Bacteroides sp.]
METTSNIKKYLKGKNIPLYKFLESIGKSNGYLNSTKNFSLETLEDIIKLYPDLNIEWLLTGEGSMLKDGPITVVDSSPEDIRLKDEVKSLKDELKESYKEIGRLEGENNLLREQLRLGDRKNEKSA